MGTDSMGIGARLMLFGGDAWMRFRVVSESRLFWRLERDE